LGNKIIKLVALTFAVIGVGTFVLIFNISMSGKRHIDETAIAGYKLAIIEDDGKCELFYQGEKGSGKLPLGPQPPCRFLTQAGGTLEFYAYSDVKVKALLVIVGTPKKPDPTIPVTMKKNYYCGDEIQGVLIRGDGVYITKLVMDAGLACTNLGLDEKFFWIFAHEKKLIGPGK